ncbi:MAG: trehalase family glycosidase [Candidatus Hadarchaeales archaeon]
MDPEQLVSRAREVLERNTKRVGEYEIVVPSPKSYPVPYAWDTAFHVLGLLYVDQEKARKNLRAILSLQRPDGMIPNAPLKTGDQDLRSQPPILLYAFRRYLEETSDKASAGLWFPRFKLFYRWWSERGDPFGKGLVSPFTGLRRSTRVLGALGRLFRSEGLGTPEFYALCSTGMDNHPIGDFFRAVKVGGLYYLPVFEILLNSSLVSGAESLAEVARRLGMRGEEKELREEAERRRKLMNELMWSEEDGFYYPASWEGEKVKVKSATAFTTLWAGVPDNRQARKLLSHLLSPEEFWGEYGVPTVAFDDPKFMSGQPPWLVSRDTYYWRGPVWAPITLLIAEGLIRYGRKRLANELVEKWVKLVEKSGFAEYFYPDGRPGRAHLGEDFGWTAAVTIYLLKAPEH